MKKNMVYFVLYVVLITELLIVITERDELEEKEHSVRDKMLNSLADSYKRPVLLAIPNRRTDYDVGAKENGGAVVVMTPVGLVSDEEKKGVEFYVDVVPGSRTPSDWPSGGLTSKNGNDVYKLIKTDDGNAQFLAKLSSEGEYSFRAYCKVERKLPSYLPDFLLADLAKRVGEQKVSTSPKEEFLIVAKRQGGVKKQGVEFLF
jgi:hypothetical protein